MKVAVIGGGAAGFFASFSIKEHHPHAQVHLFEKSDKLLSKVKISGGGRCNVTHACFQSSKLSKFYPRGEKFLKKSFSLFQVDDTISWFEKRGVELKAEPDGRMFPISDRSQTIIDCFLREAQLKKIKIYKKTGVSAIKKSEGGFNLIVNDELSFFDKIIIATGGSPKLSGFDWLSELSHNIISPLPSLFTFNMPNEGLSELMGLVVENATVRIQSTKLQYSGPVLITHWGMSGPAILKLSAWGARYLNEQNYQFTLQVNWLSIRSEEEVKALLVNKLIKIKKKKLHNANPFELPNRMWRFLLHKLELDADKIWAELSKKEINKIINILLNDTYEVSGKTTFKEEFVTCGGIDLLEIESKTMKSRLHDNLYFAGEILDIDGITGGFNFQAAWTTGYIAGMLK